MISEQGHYKLQENFIICMYMYLDVLYYAVKDYGLMIH